MFRYYYIGVYLSICFSIATLLHDSFILELGQRLQHVDADLLWIIVQTGTDEPKPIQCQDPAMQLVGLVLLVLLIFLIRYLFHGDLPSSSQT